jgi:uncharacterized protein RhaS with RHS repeats
LAGQSTVALSYGYDAAGNRTSMTDSLGCTSYTYDRLSRMTSETRTFTGLGTYPINYQYNLAGEMTSITDPFGAQMSYNRDASYTRDAAGRLVQSGMNGSYSANKFDGDGRLVGTSLTTPSG